MALSTLLGGRFVDDVGLYQTIPHDTPDAMRAGLVEARAEGYRCFQPKVGGEPNTEIEHIRALAAERRAGEVLVTSSDASKPRIPPLSVGFTDWLSITPADGLASRPAASRAAMRR